MNSNMSVGSYRTGARACGVVEAAGAARFKGDASQKWRSIPRGGFFDRHPILVPATAFSLGWIAYVVIFFRRTIEFGDLGSAYPLDTSGYWLLLVVQLLVCVISHSLTIRTIVRLYAPRWLIYGSVMFYALSPAWGLMTAADIRHPLFAAVFCVFTSSCVFALYSRHVPKWLWIQLAGGALCVSLLRSEGIFIVLPTLAIIVCYELVKWRCGAGGEDSFGLRERFARLKMMTGSPRKREEALWSDACAAFLVLSAVGLMFLLLYCVGWSLPLGDPSYGHVSATSSMSGSPMASPWNLTGTEDVAGIIPFAVVGENSVFSSLASEAALAIFAFQCLPGADVTFSWLAYLILFGVFVVVSLGIIASEKCGRDIRPFTIGLAMMVMVVILLCTPADQTLRYLMPILAAQPMFFGACFKSLS